MNSYVAGAGNIFFYWYCCALNLFQSNRSCQIDGTFPGWVGGSFIYLFVGKNVTCTSVCPILAMAPGKHELMHVSLLKYENA